MGAIWQFDYILQNQSNSMNQKLKQAGLLAILPLALVMFSPSIVEQADAVNVGSQDIIGRPGYQPGKVCGDKLC